MHIEGEAKRARYVVLFCSQFVATAPERLTGIVIRTPQNPETFTLMSGLAIGAVHSGPRNWLHRYALSFYDRHGRVIKPQVGGATKRTPRNKEFFCIWGSFKFKGCPQLSCFLFFLL